MGFPILVRGLLYIESATGSSENVFILTTFGVPVFSDKQSNQNANLAISTSQWHHNERDGISIHQPHDCLLNCLFKVQIKENIKALRHWPLWGEFTIFIWWRHHFLPAHFAFQIRKSRGFVYGIWWYQVLRIKKLFQSETIWEEQQR